MLEDMATATPPRRGDVMAFTLRGLSPSEVAALRSQFMALQSINHTPDALCLQAPKSRELRRSMDGREDPPRDGAGVGLDQWSGRW